MPFSFGQPHSRVKVKVSFRVCKAGPDWKGEGGWLDVGLDPVGAIGALEFVCQISIIAAINRCPYQKSISTARRSDALECGPDRSALG